MALEQEVSNEDLAALLIQFEPLIKAHGEAMKAWAEGVPDGGPNHDGKYPLVTGFGTSILVPCPQKQAIDALQPRYLNVKMTTGSTFTLDLVAHKSAIITLEGPAPNSNITVRLPANAPASWTCSIIQNGTGRMIFSATGSNGFYNRQGFDRTAGQGGIMTALCKSTTSQGLSNWWYFGDMSAA